MRKYCTITENKQKSTTESVLKISYSLYLSDLQTPMAKVQIIS